LASTRTTRCSCRWCRTDELRSYIALGHELGISGWIHERNQQLRPADERELAWRATDTLEKLAGVRPVRVRTPSWDFSAATLGIIRELGLQYDSSQMADDEPYELVEDGCERRRKNGTNVGIKVGQWVGVVTAYRGPAEESWEKGVTTHGTQYRPFASQAREEPAPDRERAGPQ